MSYSIITSGLQMVPASSSLPAVGNLLLVQQGGTANSTAPVGNSNAFAFTGVGAATSYNIYRRIRTSSFSDAPWGPPYASVTAAQAASNFTAMGAAGIVLPSGLGLNCGYTDSGATGNNSTNLNVPATVYQYAVTAVAGAAESAQAYPSGYTFRGQTATNSADFSGGGASAVYNDSSGNPAPGPFDIKVTYAGSGQFLHVIAPPLAQGANGFPNDFEVGWGNYLVFDVMVPDNQWQTHRMDFGITSRVPTSGGDAFSWQNNNNLWSWGTPVPGQWATMKVPFTAINMGLTTAQGSITGSSDTNTVGAPAGWGTGTLNVTNCVAPNFVDNASYIVCPGVTGASLTVAVGTAGAPTGQGTYTVVGPGIRATTNTGTQNLQCQRTCWYKSGLQSHPDMTGTVVLLFNNIGITTV